ncbi:MAG: hypothetical protein RR213_07410, partial [Raoultibacter sp.]
MGITDRLQKSRGLLRERAGVAPRYQLMFAEKDNYPVKWMATRLEVSRSGYYSWLAKGCGKDAWLDLRQVIEQLWLESDRRFGARFVHSFLSGRFLKTTLYRVRKCMREMGVKGCTPYKTKRTTIPDKNAKPRPDLIHRDFTSPVPTYKLVG